MKVVLEERKKSVLVSNVSDRVDAVEQRVIDYWTHRSPSFLELRRNELKDPISDRWMQVISEYLPSDRPLRILDVGCGSGYFSILLAKAGHQAIGIDLTEKMIETATVLADEAGEYCEFYTMDAMNLEFEDASFDAVVSRNLTWTLPDPKRAYKEWIRVLKPGGVLLNFDADYSNSVRNHGEVSEANIDSEEEIYKDFMTPQMQENAAITMSMPLSRVYRPEWDTLQLASMDVAEYGCDPRAGAKIMLKKDLIYSPLFLVWAKK